MPTPHPIPSEKAALIAAQIKVSSQAGYESEPQQTQSNSRPSPGWQPRLRLAMTAICWNHRWVLHEQHESVLPLGEKTPGRRHLESSPRRAHQHAIDGCKIVTTDHASTLFEMQRRLVPQGRTRASLACIASQACFLPPSSSTPPAPLLCAA
jgi:hypothetical protein